VNILDRALEENTVAPGKKKALTRPVYNYIILAYI
jgi:hypothetical protein